MDSIKKEIHVDLLMRILEKSQHSEYIGEAVSQLEHALQAAHFARQMKAPDHIILAALLHDIGHLCAKAGAQEMDGLGIVDHEGIGGTFLEGLGFSKDLTDPIRHHVQAKRYLCWKNPSYLKHLSDASRGTLNFQGGPMTEEEARSYEKDPQFKNRILVRRADELAKKVDFKVAGLESYREMLLSSIS